MTKQARQQGMELGEHFFEFGTSGLEHSAGQITEEWHPKLMGSLAVDVFREISDNAAVAGAFLYAAEQLLSQTERQFEPADDSTQAHEIADKFNSMLTDMESTPSEIMSEILQMMIYGWSYLEAPLKIRRGQHPRVPQLHSEHNDGLWGWRDWSVRGQDTLWRWEIDDRGKARGLWQQAQPVYTPTFVPANRCLHFKIMPRKGNPEGRSLLRNGYRTWYFLKKFEELEAIGIERDLAGLPKMEVPPKLLATNASAADQAQLLKFFKLVRKVRRDKYEGIVVPHEMLPNNNPSGYRFSLVSTGGRRPIDTNEIIKRKQSRLLMSVMAEFLVLGMDKVGSFALSSDKTDLFAVALGNILGIIDDVINRQAVPTIMHLNGWPSELAPKHTHDDIEVPNLTELGTYVGAIAGVGAITVDDSLEDHLRSVASLPPRDPTETPRQQDLPGMVGEGAT